MPLRICNIHTCSVSKTSTSTEVDLFDPKTYTGTKQRREELVTKMELEGSKFAYLGNANLPYVNNVGLAEERLQHDGKYITTIYPCQVFNRIPLRLSNVKFDPPEKSPFRSLNRMSMYKAAFLRGRPAITAECVASSQYYFEDGLRKVKPYYMVMEVFIRVLKKPCTLQMFMLNLLGERRKAWMDVRFLAGQYDVNFEPGYAEQPLKEKDYVTGIIHHHEGAVLDHPIDVLYEDKDLLVVNKPASIMIHPGSKYRLNSLLYILAKDKGHMDLRPVHRLDKNTSGVCIFAKTLHIVPKVQKAFGAKQTLKEYVALVDGQFPEGETICQEPLTHYSVSSSMTRSFAEPKECETTFRRLDFNGKASLVLCVPKTGRTHQIRQHLSMLGYPVINDYLYNPLDTARRYSPDHNVVQKAVDSIRNRILTGENLENVSQSTTTLGYCHVPDCLMCELGKEFETHEHSEEQMFMCLHSWRYSIMDKTFEAPWPQWATDHSYLDSTVYEPREKYQLKKKTSC